MERKEAPFNRICWEDAIGQEHIPTINKIAEFLSEKGFGDLSSRTRIASFYLESANAIREELSEVWWLAEMIHMGERDEEKMVDCHRRWKASKKQNRTEASIERLYSVQSHLMAEIDLAIRSLREACARKP